jgi:hypothetical protein
MAVMKKLFSKSNKDWDKPFSEKVAKSECLSIPTAELEMWIEKSIYEVGRCLSGFTKSREMVYLQEARTGAEALHAVVEELYKRNAKP